MPDLAAFSGSYSFRVKRPFHNVLPGKEQVLKFIVLVRWDRKDLVKFSRAFIICFVLVFCKT
jgi:hypothetical protein